MPAFVNPGYVAEHPGLVRAADVARALNEVSTDFRQDAREIAEREVFSARGLGLALLTAAVAAIALAAQQLMDTWTDSHLFAGWIVLWVIVFGASLLLAAPTRRLARRLHAAWQLQRARWAEAAADHELMRLAQFDPRVMADIRIAASRQEA